MAQTFAQLKEQFETDLNKLPVGKELLIPKDIGLIPLKLVRLLAMQRGFIYVNPSTEKLKPVPTSGKISLEKRNELEKKYLEKLQAINNLKIINPEKNEHVDERISHLIFLIEKIYNIDSQYHIGERDMKDFPSEKIPEKVFNVRYKDLEKGSFVSIDVKSASFVSTSLLEPGIFQGCKNWDEFIDTIKGDNCLKNKITRNTYLSLLGQEKQNTVLDWMMYKIYSELNSLDAFSLKGSHDEIIIHFPNGLSQEEFQKIQDLVLKVSKTICDERKNTILDTNEMFHVKQFEVVIIYDKNFKFYVKKYPERFELKDIPKEKKEEYEEYCRKKFNWK